MRLVAIGVAYGDAEAGTKKEERGKTRYRKPECGKTFEACRISKPTTKISFALNRPVQ
jgi:hypothetical protein